MKKNSLSHTHSAEQSSQTHYDKVAHRFDHSRDSFLSSFFRKFILENLVIPENSAVLDVGAATGRLLTMLHDRTFFYGTGLDISPEMTGVARDLHPEFNFFTGTAQALPFPDSSFDLLICSASFHHFPDPAGFLAEAQRVLRPDGRLVIADIRIPVYDLRKLYNRRLAKYSEEGDVKVYGQHELVKLFQSSNFRVIDQKARLQIQYFELGKMV